MNKKQIGEEKMAYTAIQKMNLINKERFHCDYGPKQPKLYVNSRKRNDLDMLPPSRTLKYKTYLGVFLCQEKVRLILQLK